MAAYFLKIVLLIEYFSLSTFLGSQAVLADSSDLKDLIQNGADVTDRELMAALLDRVVQLEARETQHLVSIQTLQGTLRRQNRRIVVLEELVQVADTPKAKVAKQEANNANVEEQIVDQRPSEAIGILPARSLSDISRTRRQQYTAVAFYAAIDQHHLQNLGANQDIPFDKVYTNVGNGYRPNLGVFIAPEPGTYVFSTTIMDVNKHDTRYYFNVNHTAMGNLFIHGSEAYLASTSRTATLRLRQGDEVSVRNAQVSEGVYGFEYSSFTGFMLSFDDSAGVIVG